MFLLNILHLKFKYSKCNKNGKLAKSITFALKFQNEQTWSQNVCLNKLYTVVFHLDKIELKLIKFSSGYQKGRIEMNFGKFISNSKFIQKLCLTPQNVQ